MASRFTDVEHERIMQKVCRMKSSQTKMYKEMLDVETGRGGTAARNVQAAVGAPLIRTHQFPRHSD